MGYSSGGEISKSFSPGGGFTGQIFTVKLYGVDSAGMLRQSVLMVINLR